VIDEMLEVIPESERELRQNLIAERETAHYAAPEMIGHRFQSVALLLSIATRGREPRPDWVQRTLLIWNEPNRN